MHIQRNTLIIRLAFIVYAALCSLELSAQETFPLPHQTQVPGTNTQTVSLPDGSPILKFNRTRTFEPLSRISDASTVNDNSNPEQVSISTIYTNGLGGTIQTVKQSAVKSPGGQYLHMVIPNDTRIRTDKYKFMSYPSYVKNFNQAAVNNSVAYHNDSRYPSEAGVSDIAVISTGQEKNTSSTTERSTTTYEPGKARMGQERGTKTTTIINKVVAGQNLPGTNVRMWSVDASGFPVSSGVYSEGKLNGIRSQTADGTENYVFKNQSGKPVYEASLQKIATGYDPVTGSIVNRRTYAETYYIYDDMDRLRYIIAPKAVDVISNSGWVLNTQIIEELCFSYLYDAEGRQHSLHKPGEQGYSEVVYRKDGLVIMRRSPLEMQKGLWELVFYDKSKRVIATALLTNNDNRANWQSLANSEITQPASNAFYYIWGAGKGQHPPKTGLAATEILSLTYYDEYPASLLAGETYNPAPFQPHLLSVNTAEVPAQRGSMYGFATATEAKVMHNTEVSTLLQDWVSNKTYYDNYGREIYSVGQNATGAIDSLYKQYNAKGANVLNLYLRNAVHNGNNRRTTELESYSYEPNSGRLTGVWRSINGAPGEPAVSYSYDPMGRMSKEVLGNQAETRIYTYNVRGELLGINEDYALSGNKAGDMSFGEALRYDHGYVYPRYDGLISGMIWRGSGGTAVRAHSYTYAYDSAGRMISARYYEGRAPGAVSSVWNILRRNYSQTTAYDLNGNITSATRYGVSQNPALPGIFMIDRLNYTYLPNSNKLQSVNDAILNDYQTGDYVPKPEWGYNYDVSGNLIEDKNKSISNVAYTFFNKPQTVYLPNRTIYYTYDATGNKLQEILKNGSRLNYTNYISGAVYKSGILNYIATAQGRTNMVFSTPRQEYFVKDHLGNIRSTVASSVTTVIGPPELERKAYTASYENENESAEEVFFDKVAVLRDDKPGSNTLNDQKAAQLNDRQRLGTSIMLKVMAGDKVDINADNFYESLSYNEGGNEVPANTIFEQVFGSLAGNSSLLNPAEGGNLNAVSERLLNNSAAMNAYEELLNAETDQSKPKAYLNFLFFDEAMNLLPEHSRIWQADGENDWSKIGSEESASLEMPQNGYVVAYLSNQSDQTTWFDNMNLTISNSILLEEHHYYAYGLPIAGLSSMATNASPHRQRYQSNEYFTEFGLNWMDFNNRQYDPQLGRFLSIDPLADRRSQQRLSPYHAMGCNPVSLIDPLGLSSSNSTMLPGVVVMAHRIVRSTYSGFEGSSFLFGSSPWSQIFTTNNIKDELLAEAMGLSARLRNGIGGRNGKFLSEGPVPQAPVNVRNTTWKILDFQAKDASDGSEYNAKGLEAHFLVDGSEYTEFQWLQTVETTHPRDGETSPYLDEDVDSHSFFYYTNEEVEGMAQDLIRLNSNAFFDDRSSRDAALNNVSWSAHLTLVGRMAPGDKWNPVVTIQWGWNMVNGSVTPTPWSIVPINTTNSNYLYNYNKGIRP